MNRALVPQSIGQLYTELATDLQTTGTLPVNPARVAQSVAQAFTQLQPCFVSIPASTLSGGSVAAQSVGLIRDRFDTVFAAKVSLHVKPYDGTATVGDGTSGNPFNGWRNVPQAADTRYRLLTGRHPDRLHITANNVTIQVDAGAWIDGTESLDGGQSFGASDLTVQGFSWVQIGTSQIWKKAIFRTVMLFLDGTYADPWIDSGVSKTEAQVTAGLPAGGWTIIEANTSGVSSLGLQRILYVNFPAGKSPSNTVITAAHPGKFIDRDSNGVPLVSASNNNYGAAVSAYGRSGLRFEGAELLVQGCGRSNGFMTAFWFDNCTDVTVAPGCTLTARWCVTPIRISGTAFDCNDFRLYDCWMGISFDSANLRTDTQQTAQTYPGERSIIVRNWRSERCGTRPFYSVGSLDWTNDADSGAAGGYYGGALGDVTFLNGVVIGGGPSEPFFSPANRSAGRGTAVIFATIGTYGFSCRSLTVDVLEVQDAGVRSTIDLVGVPIQDVRISRVWIKNARRFPLATLTAPYPVIRVEGVTNSAIINNITIQGGQSTQSAIRLVIDSAATGLRRISDILIQGLTMPSGFASGGLINYTGPLSGLIIDRIIADAALNGTWAKVGASTQATYSTLAAFKAAGWNQNGSEGDVTLNASGRRTGGLPINIGPNGSLIGAFADEAV